jgi:hypothetical protein
MGAIIHENHNKILALYDELAMFLSQMSGKKWSIHMSWLFFFSYRELPRGLEKLVSEATI